MATRVTVESLPDCNMPDCGKAAYADVLIPQYGQWGYLCRDHYIRSGAGLGTGRGQLLEVRKHASQPRIIRLEHLLNRLEDRITKVSARPLTGADVQAWQEEMNLLVARADRVENAWREELDS